MLKLIAENYINASHIKTVLPFYQELVEKTRLEKGCIRYELCQDTQNPEYFIFIEEWADENALNAHIQSEHFKRLIPKISQYTSKPQVLTHLKQIY